MTFISELQTVIAAAGIDAGLAVWHIESGEQFDINGSSSFPMASTFKIPILAVAGKQLQAGRLKLDYRITMKDADKSIGSGILQSFEAGVCPTVRDLLTLMIIISDNTATDMTLDLLGGPAVIEQTMHELGLNDIYFKLNVKDLLKTLFPPEIRDLPVEEIEKWANANQTPADSLSYSRGAENNVSTPLAMNKLLHLLYQGEIVDNPTKDEMIGILLKQQLNQRLPRFLPNGVKFAHKTGTIGGFANDAGILYVSDESHVIVTLFTEWNVRAVWNQPEARWQRLFEVESAMGKIGRMIYEHYKG